MGRDPARLHSPTTREPPPLVNSSACDGGSRASPFFPTRVAGGAPALTSPYIDATPSDLYAEDAYPLSTDPRPVTPASLADVQMSSPPPTPECPPFGPLGGMNIIVGGALAPGACADTPVRQRSLRPCAKLRLPSFQTLGIAAPHPDRFGILQPEPELPVSALDGTWSPSRSKDTLPEPYNSPAISGTAQLPMERGYFGSIDSDKLLQNVPLSPIPQCVQMLTPPDERHDVQWNMTLPSIPVLISAPLDSPPSDPVLFAPPRESTTTEVASSITKPTTEPILPPSSATDWIDDAMEIIHANLRAANKPSLSLNVLCHALPSPSTTGHMFSHIINQIQGSQPDTPDTPGTWINVFHAVHGRINLADIPTSPPVTPAPSAISDDYFTQKVFDSAVSIVDYQDDLPSLPRSPRPVVPPASVDLGIVERYIPPSSPKEFADMFNPLGPSILLDRLVELSAHQGTLLFIYPTHSGAQTFLHDYLGPILDPLLRQTAVVHGLSADLSRDLGSMPAASLLPDFASLTASIHALCARLSDPSQESKSPFATAGQQHPRFTLAYSSPHSLSLTRSAWAKEWYATQEKRRLRQLLTRYVLEAQQTQLQLQHVRKSVHVERVATATELLLELLKGVCEREYPVGKAPKRGVEVGVFVIRRTA